MLLLCFVPFSVIISIYLSKIIWLILTCHILAGLRESSGSLTVQRSSKGPVAFSSIDPNGGNVVIENTTSGARAKVVTKNFPSNMPESFSKCHLLLLKMTHHNFIRLS